MQWSHSCIHACNPHIAIRLAATSCTLVIALLSSRGQSQTFDRDAFFERRIRPLLVTHCYSCHSRESGESGGGLRLDTAEAIRKGGIRGPAVIPGDTEGSLLLRAVRQEGVELQMPPDYKLKNAEIRDLERWVSVGAPDPRLEAVVETPPPSSLDNRRETHWAFQPMVEPPLPAVADESWTITAIDRYVLARLESAGLRPVNQGNRETLIRRATFDLTGLPPTPDEVDEFLRDQSEYAFERVIDRLLESQQFGERWARHWLDVARYSESVGRTRNYSLPYAWRYRDYVVWAFNSGLPFDQFVKQQVAGDLIPATTDASRARGLVATGFLAMGAHDLDDDDHAKHLMDVADEQIDAMSRGFMALTVSCARCHDHKFDPIPTSDYYALAGIFRSSSMQNGFKSVEGMDGSEFSRRWLHAIGDGPTLAARIEYSENMESLEERILEHRSKMEDATATVEERSKATDACKKCQKELAQLMKEGAPRDDLAMGVKESDSPIDCQIHRGGSTKSLGPVVPRGVLNLFSFVPMVGIPLEQSGREQLAAWLTEPRHPLTARVFVNRVWSHLFGKGLVESVDNFGMTGSRPSHPQLLDYLSLRFVEDGWSVKRLIRRIMLSRCYQLGSAHNKANYAVDPDNRLVWRMSVRRLEVEAVRDAMLAISNQLRRNPPVASTAMERGVYRLNKDKADPPASWTLHRSVYQPIQRGFIPGMFDVFDFPDPSQVIGRRNVTTVAPQALFMMNNEFVAELAANAAAELLENAQSTDANGRVSLVFRQTLGRRPSQTEMMQVLEYLDSLGADGAAEADVWAHIYHAMFACAEFRYLL